MIYMGCDYAEGAAPEILDALVRTNMEQSEGYSMDEHCMNAAKLIKETIGRDDVDVHFTVGGTQTNITVIASALRPFEAVIAPATGHICRHETGGVEATGHKIFHVATEDGKITAKQIEDAKLFHTDEHFVKPKMVYISQPTELGTMYSLKELGEISAVCRKYDLYLYIDGARLAVGLTNSATDFDIKDLPRLCDVFYLGGTKIGMLFGEAIVIVNDKLKPDFRFMIKHCGAMLAKGRLLGVQFEEMFKDQGKLYYALGSHANAMADKLRAGLAELGFQFAVDSPTNQIFIRVSDAQAEALTEYVVYEPDGTLDPGYQRIRFCTSWATPEEDVDKLLEVLKKIKEVG